MSSDPGAGHGAVPDMARDSHDGPGHATLRGYLTGFGLSVVLTAVPFWLVMNGVISDKAAASIVILVIAVVQIFVHMIYFLHMNAKVESGWSLMALIFTLILVVIVLSGSLWITFHLAANMMPANMNDLP